MLYDPKWEKPTKPLEPWRMVLLDAADLIDKHGHCQRALERDGKFCMAAAMIAANVMSAGDLALAFARLQAYCGGSFVAWNNEEGRTKEEVVAALLDVATT